MIQLTRRYFDHNVQPPGFVVRQVLIDPKTIIGIEDMSDLPTGGCLIWFGTSQIIVTQSVPDLLLLMGGEPTSRADA